MTTAVVRPVTQRAIAQLGYASLDDAVLELTQQGAPIGTVAKRLRIERPRVRNILKEHGINLDGMRYATWLALQDLGCSSVDDAIVRLTGERMSNTEITARLHIQTQRVGETQRRLGIQPDHVREICRPMAQRRNIECDDCDEETHTACMRQVLRGGPVLCKTEPAELVQVATFQPEQDDELHEIDRIRLLALTPAEEREYRARKAARECAEWAKRQRREGWREAA